MHSQSSAPDAADGQAVQSSADTSPATPGPGAAEPGAGGMPGHTTVPDVDPRRSLLTADLAARLRPVVAHLDDAAFAQLVDRMTERRLRWLDRYSGQQPHD